MSFTDQKPFVVSAQDVAAKWGVRGEPATKHLRCAWCGHVFAAGDVARWVYTNDEPAATGTNGNPFICERCDGPREAILAKLREMAEMARTKLWWWFT